MKKKFRFSIGLKTLILLFVFSILLVEIPMTYFAIVSSKGNQQSYKNTATNLSATVAEVVNIDEFRTVKNAIADKIKYITDNGGSLVDSTNWGSDEWNEYTAQFAEIEASAEFKHLKESLQKISNANSDDVDCVYLSYVDQKLKYFIYVVDSAEEDACPPGCLDPIFPINEEILEEGHLDRGFPAYITDTEEYGWLVTAGTTVKVGDDIIGYAMVDVSMSVVRARQADQIVRLFIYMTVTIILICAVIFLIIYLSFIKPVKKITSIASSYDSENPAKSHDNFDKLEIKNHDELYDLTLSIKKMENDVNNKIIELTETNRRLVESQQFARKMTELANKDALTGVRNKIAYDGMVNVINEEISKGNSTPFGVIMVDLNYLKNINDDYGHDSGDTALIKLCNLICATFTHSPVFRVGGDEFVVIVRTVDYERVEKLINEFNTKIDELSHDDYLLPAEKISAAIGFSRFDKKTDKCVDDVFKRADKAMYERKRSMKHLD